MIKHENYKEKSKFWNLNLKEIEVKKRGRKKILKIATLVLIAVMGCSGIVTFKKLRTINAYNKGIDRSEYTILKKGKSIESKSFLGEINCQEPINVSAEIYNNQIKEVNFKLGDQVKAGDILAKIDSTDLEKQIENIKNKNIDQENRSKTLLEQKKINYDAAVKNRDEESNAEIINIKNELKFKENEYNTIKQNYEEAKIKLSNFEINESELNEIKIKCDNAKSEYEVAKIRLQNLRDKLQLAVEDTKKAYDLEKMENNNISSKNELQNSIDELQKYTITAPIDGVIVDIKAEKGKNADGVLFKIQNMDQQVVNIYIKENDVDELKIGQRASISPKITGKESMSGTLTSIEPITNVISDNKVNLKDNPIDKQAAYVGQIVIDKFDDVLEDDTKVKVDVQIDNRECVYRLPLSNIIDEDGEKFIYVADNTNGEYIVKKVPVILGKETRFDVEVSGENITEGIIVLNNPMNYEVGSSINIRGVL